MLPKMPPPMLPQPINQPAVIRSSIQPPQQTPSLLQILGQFATPENRKAGKEEASQFQLSDEFFDKYGNWLIASTPKPVENKSKTHRVSLQNPETGEIQQFELTGDKNSRTLNPGNVATTQGQIGGVPLGKPLSSVFDVGARKTILSKTARPVLIKQNEGDTMLTEIPGSNKTYMEKNLKDFVRTYLPKDITVNAPKNLADVDRILKLKGRDQQSVYSAEDKAKISKILSSNKSEKQKLEEIREFPRLLFQENSEKEQEAYYNKLRANIKLKFNVNLPKWAKADSDTTALQSFLNSPERIAQMERFIMKAEGGKLQSFKRVR